MRMNLYRILAVLALLCVAVAARASNDYAMATGDMLRISVYDHPDLATETRVSENGTILFPLIGEVQVAGGNAQAAAGRIAKALEAGGFIRSPQVNVVVLEFKGQEVAVLGLVNRPGKFPLQKSSRVTDILALAGGVVPTAADGMVLITSRGGKTEHIDIDLPALFQPGGDALNKEVANNDILYVPREPRFYIYGEVQRPGSFRLEKNMNVVQALSVGGGLTPRGTQKGIRVMRRGADGAMQSLEVQLSDPLKPDDVIYVKESLF